MARDTFVKGLGDPAGNTGQGVAVAPQGYGGAQGESMNALIAWGTVPCEDTSKA